MSNRIFGRIGLFRTCVMIACLAAPQPSPAQTIPDKVVEAFADWADARGITAHQVVVAYQGEVKRNIATETGQGTVDIASLSKAVTATCLADLVQEGRLDWSAPVGRYLPGLAAPLADVILSSLVSHAGGLWPDSTQGPMADWRGSGDAVHEHVTRDIARRPLVDMSYRYNNENYAVLGAVIEAVAGETYSRACGQRVFAPLGMTSAEPSPLFGLFAAWGAGAPTSPITQGSSGTGSVQAIPKTCHPPIPGGAPAMVWAWSGAAFPAATTSGTSGHCASRTVRIS